MLFTSLIEHAIVMAQQASRPADTFTESSASHQRLTGCVIILYAPRTSNQTAKAVIHLLTSLLSFVKS